MYIKLKLIELNQEQIKYKGELNLATMSVALLFQLTTAANKLITASMKHSYLEFYDSTCA